MPVLGAAGWAAALATLHLPAWLLGVVLLALALLVARRRGPRSVTRLGWLLASAAVAASALLHLESVDTTPLGGLAAERASVRATLVVRTDPVLEQGRYSGYVRFRALLVDVEARGGRTRMRAPVLVIAGRGWAAVRLDSRLRVAGRLDRADASDLAAVLVTRGPPVVLDEPGAVLLGADRVRAAIRAGVAGQDPGPRALVPALVDGDDAGLPAGVEEDFRTAGLTHLLAVSGTNLTLIVGFLLVIARWCGVRARGLAVVGILGVVGFVLLARTEPSVLRAAVMGSVALVGMGVRGQERGTRALGVAVVGLLLVDPWLARSLGFALSVVATAGILLLAPPWRDALARWLPRWLAEAVSVPLAAQLACTPLVAAISGQVSLVAVAANLAVAWAVGPATVLGLLGGLGCLVWQPAGQLVAIPAAWCASWIIEVARVGSDLPVAAVGWSTGVLSIGLLALTCVLVAVALTDVLAHPTRTVALAVVGTSLVLLPTPTPGWPPDDWVMVACDVGQGDGLVLNAGNGNAVVVDAGPAPDVMDGCLDRLGVRAVPVVVLTHFHADHVDGLSGVMAGRRVGRIVTSPLPDPPRGARSVTALARRAGVPLRVARYAETVTVGALAWQVLAPSRSHPGSESPPNDASLVLLVETRGVRLLLMGDQEVLSQADLDRSTTDLRADVLKVAHHGSSKQDADLVAGLGARLAVVSAGADNDYGHPARSTLRLLERAGMRVRRTDLDGDVAVVVDDHGRLGTATRRPGLRPGRSAVGDP